MSVSLKTLSKLVGVAPETISRVLNNHPSQRISAAKRQTILDSVKRYGYQPNPAARSLQKQKSMSVAMILHYETHLISTLHALRLMEIVSALQTTLKESFYTLSMAFISRKQPELTFYKLFESRQICDALFFPRGIATKPILDFARDKNLPCAAVQDERALDWPIHHFMNDVFAEMKTSIRHLQQLGHQRITMMAGSMGSRAKAFAHMRAKQPTSIQKQWSVYFDENAGPFQLDFNRGQAAMEHLLAQPQRPTAIIAGTDMIAFGAIQALRSHGMEEGKDMSIVGHGNLESLEYSPFGQPVLTTFEPPVQKMGAAVAESLLASLKKGGTPPRHEEFVSDFIQRKSTAPPA